MGAGTVALMIPCLVALTGADARASGARAAGPEDVSSPSPATAAPAQEAPPGAAASERETAADSFPGARPEELAGGFPAAASTTRFAQAGPDFAFGQPRFSIALRGLQQRPRADSDFHTFLHENFFVRADPQDDPNDPAAGRMNFDATGIGLDVGFGVTPRLDARVGIDYALVRAETEDRAYEDEFGLPIQQTTEISQWGVQGDVVFALTPRGRAIGQYVWVPNAFIPYVGGGVGVIRYRAMQEGDFLDIFDYVIFSDSIGSQGWAPSLHAFGGVDIRLTRQVLLTTEARYAWATTELDGGLAGFDLDLTGLRISAGVRFVF